MTGTPADHPAVVNPQAATATQKVLAAPVLGTPAVVGQAAAPTPNNLMSLLRDLHPNGIMNQVVIKNFNENKNPIATGLMGGQQYGAWTQSASLVYVRDDLFGRYDITLAYLLKHEAEHILQFRKNPGAQPAAFEDMLAFEVGAYTRTHDWIASPQGIKDLTAAGFDPEKTEKNEYDATVKIAKGAAEGVAWLGLTTVGRRIGRVLARAINGAVRPLVGAQLIPMNPQMSVLDFYFDSMADNEMIPPANPKVDKNGNVVLDAQGNPEPLRYLAGDMYLQPSDANFTARMKQLRFFP